MWGLRTVAIIHPALQDLGVRFRSTFATLVSLLNAGIYYIGNDSVVPALAVIAAGLSWTRLILRALASVDGDFSLVQRAKGFIVQATQGKSEVLCRL